MKFIRHIFRETAIEKNTFWIYKHWYLIYTWPGKLLKLPMWIWHYYLCMEGHGKIWIVNLTILSFFCEKDKVTMLTFLWNYCALYHSSSLHREFYNKCVIKQSSCNEVKLAVHYSKACVIYSIEIRKVHTHFKKLPMTLLFWHDVL